MGDADTVDGGAEQRFFRRDSEALPDREARVTWNVVAAELVRAGWSLGELAELPLDSWLALYKAVKNKETERLVSLVTVFHAAEPKQLRDRLESQARKILGTEAEDVPLWADRDKFKRWLRNIPGVAIEEKKAGE